MSKRRELTIITLIIISIIVMTLGIFELREYLSSEELNQSKRLAQVEQAAYERENALQKEEDKTRQLASELDISEKLNQGLDLNILYIGNEEKDRYGNYIGRPKALESLILDFQNNYTGSLDYRYLSINGASIIMGWELYRKLEDPLYDLLLLDGYLSPDLDEESQGLFTEGLIRNYLEDNPKGAIIWCSLDPPSVSQDLLIDKYHIHLLGDNGQDLKKLLLENKTNYKRTSSIYGDELSFLADYQSDIHPSSEAGFRVSDGLLASDKRQSYLSYDKKAAYYIFQYAVHPDGGLIHLLLDDQEVKTIDTASDLIHTKTLLVDTKDVEEVALLTESGYGESVVLVSVSICDKNGS